MRGSLHLLSNYRPYLVWSLYRRPLSCRGNMAFSLPYFDVRFVGAILVKARPKRNISATVVADVKRFSHQINTDEVFGTHRCRYQRENGAAWGNSASDSVAPTRISSKKPST